MALFVREITFEPGGADRLAVRPAHREYLQKLLDDGKLVAAGPWEDDTGAILIYDAADEEELARLVAADPYTGAGVATEVRVRSWNRIFPAAD